MGAAFSFQPVLFTSCAPVTPTGFSPPPLTGSRMPAARYPADKITKRGFPVLLSFPAEKHWHIRTFALFQALIKN